MRQSTKNPTGSLFDEGSTLDDRGGQVNAPDAHVTALSDTVPTRVAKRDQAAERRRANENTGLRLSERHAEIAGEDVQTANAIGYMARWMVHAGLPYTQPKGNPPAWFKRSGKIYFALQPGYYQREFQKPDARGRIQTHTEAVSYGYPFGSLPRLILAYMSTVHPPPIYVNVLACNKWSTGALPNLFFLIAWLLFIRFEIVCGFICSAGG